MDRDTMWQAILGELEPGQAEQVRQRLAADATLQAEFDRLESLFRTIGEAAAQEQAFAVPDDALSALFDQAPAAGPSLLDRLAEGAAAIIASLTGDSWRKGLEPAGIRGDDGSRRLSFMADQVTIEVRLEPSATRLSAFDCVGRIASDQGPATLLWRELDGGETHELVVDADGFFECTVLDGRHRIEMEIAGSVVLSPVIRHPLRSEEADQ